MNAPALMDSPLWLTAGWTMLHLLWIGALVGLFAWAGRKLLAEASPGSRYLFALGCLVGLAIAPGIVAARVHVPALSREAFEPETLSVSKVAASVTPKTESAAGSEVQQSADHPNAPAVTTLHGLARPLYSAVVWLPWLWLVGTPVVFVLLAAGLIGADRLRKQSRLFDQGPLFEACRKLARSLKIARRVSVGICDRITTPILIGVIRPMILLPPAALVGCSMDQLEMILLHELAHLRRWDNLINLGQRLVESVLFFHPVVWWVSRWVRLEREHCCDSIVVTTTGKAQQYAETLAALSHASRRRLSPAVAMAEHHTVARIRRILNLEDPTMRLSRASLLLTSLLLITPAVLFAGYAVYGNSLQTPAVSSDESRVTTAPDAPALVSKKNVNSAGKRQLLISSNRAGNYDIFLFDEDGNELKNLTNHDAGDSGPSWSPDGTRIAFASNRAGNFDIYVMHADGSDVRQLTNDSRNDGWPTWSPNGKTIAFTRDMDPDERLTGDILTIEPDGTDEKNLTNDPAHDGDAKWSPDGKRIAFSSTRGGGAFHFQLYVMGSDGRNVQRVLEKRTAYTYPAWSPDGNNLVFGSYAQGGRAIELFLFDFETGEHQQMTTVGGLNTYPAWSPDGKQIAFQHHDNFGEPGTLHIMDAGGANLKQVLTGETNARYGGGRPAWKPILVD